MPPASAAGRLFIRATTAAVIARSNSDGPNVFAVAKPCVGAVRIALKADSAPAIAHARDDMRLAKTPDMRAASGFAAAARMASPNLLRFRKSAMAITKIGERISIPEYACVTSRGRKLNTGSHDGCG